SATDNHTDAQKIYINPKTQLLVKDQLTGLDAGAAGTVNYTAYTGCVNGQPTGSSFSLGSTTVIATGAAGAGVQDAGVSSGQVTVSTAQGTLYFVASFVAGNG